MKSLPILFCIAILVACQQPEKQPVNDTFASDTFAIRAPVQDDPLTTPKQENENPLFHSDLFKEKDIYGQWANSPHDSTCVYKITPDVFMHCDRGDSGMLAYNFADDTILFFEEDGSSYEAKILRADSDTLIIKWEGIDAPDVKIRMKN